MKKPNITDKLSKEIATLDPDDQDAIVDVFTLLNPIDDFMTIMNLISCFKKPQLRKLTIKALMIRAGYLFSRDAKIPS